MKKIDIERVIIISTSVLFLALFGFIIKEARDSLKVDKK